MNTITIGDVLSQTQSGTTNCYFPYYEPYKEIVQQYYPIYYKYWEDKNKTEQAFKICQKLIELKLVEINKVKDFIELVNKLIEIL